jgi:thiol-disulfide isomerase/thioredoxin
MEDLMKFLAFLFLLWPLLTFAYEEKSDDHNFLPLGVLTRQQILSGRNIYNHNYVEYVPKSDPVQAIHNCSQPVEVKVVFGDWCKDSKKHVPAFIKTMEFADNKSIQITYINVSRDKKEPADMIKDLNIENVPTFIVYSNGKELGRIVETPKLNIESDFAALLPNASE